jgi:hypothetical protein
MTAFGSKATLRLNRNRQLLPKGNKYPIQPKSIRKTLPMTRARPPAPGGEAALHRR